MKDVVILGVIIIGFLASNASLAQKWGKIPKEELQMTSVLEDPEADAAILFDIGDLKIIREFSLILKRHVRIKILTEEGKKYADIRLRYFRGDRINGLEAQCFLSNGKKIEFDDKQIFEEESDRWNYKVFAVPGVETGSVIEYKYELFSKRLTFLEAWRFQNREFTYLSQFSISLLAEFDYNVFFTNILGLDPEPDVEDMIVPIGSGRYTTRKKYTWRMENIEPNQRGRIIQIPGPKNLNWLSINTKATLGEDGALSCNSVLRYEGYRAMKVGKELVETDQNEYLENKLKEGFGEINLDSLGIVELNNIEASLYANIKFEVPDSVDMNGEMVYFSYPTMTRIDSNPFKRENRKFPIAYNYPLS